MATSRPTSSRPSARASQPVRRAANPRPLQFTPFTPAHFSTPEGLAFVNLQFSQMVNEMNRQTGQAGPVVIPAGLDLAGGKLSGLGKPSAPSDAVSLAHADASYSPAINSPALDIGGTHALKGLTSLFLQLGQVKAGLPTNYSGGGAVNLFGLVIQLGLIADMDTAVFPMDFPTPFPTACQSLVAFTTGPNDRITYAPALPTQTQFTLANNGTLAGAFWIAMGW